jgi:phosphatidylglycerol:prolipoprotein diacylglycerol transferase
MIFSESGIQIGLLNFSYYGLVIVLATILSIILAHRRITIRNLDAHLLWPLAIVILVTSIVGARLWYTTFPPPSAIRLGLTAEFYRNSILDFFAFWQGGFAMPGAILGAVVGFLIFSWRNKLSIKKWLRAMIIVIPFAASIILWGNFLTYQNYGLPAAVPWAIQIAPPYRMPGYTSLPTYHPLFLYQSLWALITISIVILYERKTHRDTLSIPLTGSILSFGLLMLETIRIDAGLASTMNMAFWTIILLFSLMRMYFLPRRNMAKLQI